ncbi:MAG: ABC transporter ATP-binding protein [Tissierellia bacterium]|nr:ABC transporter ATP-binding protein [Tissierellia bacterium]
MEDKRTGISYVFTLAKHERVKLLVGMGLAIISALLSLVPYIVIYKIFFMLFTHATILKQILFLASMAVLAAVLQAILISFAGILSHTAAFNTIYTLKLHVLEHISKFNIGFFQNHSSGEMKSLLFDDIDRVEIFLAHSTLELAQAIVIPIIMFGFMLKIHWIMALVMLIPLILGVLIPMLMIKNYPDLTDELAENTNHLNASANEFIKAMPIIKMYHLTAQKFEQYKNALNTYLLCLKKMCIYSCYPLSITLVILDSAILFTLPIGGFLYLRGDLSATSFLVFIMLTMCFFISFLNSLTIFMQSMELGSGLDNIKKIMDIPPQKDGEVILSKKNDFAIEFENVSFRYQTDGPSILNNINMYLQPNTINAFVGPSGAGKTTAGQLLGRYWDVTAGSIKINDVPIDQLKIENLMDLTAFVFQDVFLVEDSIFENIRMNTNTSKEQVIAAAKAAQIHDVIMALPKGYKTIIGDQGIKLSGGEKQRISIARAILKDAPIIIFDEATSYADIENEYKIQTALQNLLKNKTTIMIAHRLHTIMHADKIMVFHDGYISESGSHEELLRKNGLYSNMWASYRRDFLKEEG